MNLDLEAIDARRKNALAECDKHEDSNYDPRWGELYGIVDDDMEALITRVRELEADLDAEFRARRSMAAVARVMEASIGVLTDNIRMVDQLLTEHGGSYETAAAESALGRVREMLRGGSHV